MCLPPQDPYWVGEIKFTVALSAENEAAAWASLGMFRAMLLHGHHGVKVNTEFAWGPYHSVDSLHEAEKELARGKMPAVEEEHMPVAQR